MSEQLKLLGSLSLISVLGLGAVTTVAAKESDNIEWHFGQLTKSANINEQYTVHDIAIGANNLTVENKPMLYMNSPETNSSGAYYTVSDTVQNTFNLTFNWDLSFSIQDTTTGKYLSVLSGNVFSQSKQSYCWHYDTNGIWAWYENTNDASKSITKIVAYNNQYTRIAPYNDSTVTGKEITNYSIARLIAPEDTCTNIDRTTFLSDRVWNNIVYYSV